MMVRFDRSRSCSLYLSWGGRRWSRGLAWCRRWEIWLLLPGVQHRRRRCRRRRGRSCRGSVLLHGMDRGRGAGVQVVLRVVVVMEVRRREVREVVVMVVVVTCRCRRRTAIVSRHHFCVGRRATKRHSKKCPLTGKRPGQAVIWPSKNEICYTLKEVGFHHTRPTCENIELSGPDLLAKPHGAETLHVHEPERRPTARGAHWGSIPGRAAALRALRTSFPRKGRSVPRARRMRGRRPGTPCAGRAYPCHAHIPAERPAPPTSLPPLAHLLPPPQPTTRGVRNFSSQALKHTQHPKRVRGARAAGRGGGGADGTGRGRERAGGGEGGVRGHGGSGGG